MTPTAPGACALALVACLAAAGADTAGFDRQGRLTYMLADGNELAVRSRLAPSPAYDAVRVRRDAGGTSWTAEGFRQSVVEDAAGTHIVIETADRATWTLQVPREEFTGGTATAGASSAAIPPHKTAESGFLHAEADGFVLRSPKGMELSVAFDRPLPVRFEDRWDRNGRYYAAVIEFLQRVHLTLKLRGKPDTSPAHLRLSADQRRYRLHGFGGNYCFGIESPVTQYTLKNLQVAWARTEMSLVRWAPENDQPDSRLRREFELMRQLNQMRIPYVSSIWQLPERLYSDPGDKPHRQEKRKVPADKWPELVDAIGSYLAYAKEHYGAEPDLFSFNEANIGIDVLLTPEEHRDAIKRIGADLAKRGLRTKMLLADATGPRGTHEYALPAANDADAMRYVGAVGFHSWGGGTPEQYRAWGDLAEWLGLPLLVTEMGVDADAHRGKRYDSYDYGMREVQMYQELLLHARPQATIQWEFTADYGTVTDDLKPTPRFWLVKHFSDLTPRNADALGTSSDHPKVLFTAFATDGVYTLHVANMGAAREITIDGLPEGIGELRAVETSEAEQFKELGGVRVTGGSISLQAPARSLVTLTTLRGGL
jgi:hypothetical protein